MYFLYRKAWALSIRTSHSSAPAIKSDRCLWLALTAARLSATGFAAPPVQAALAFARQPGQPGSAWHVGAFGALLTPYGRDFDLNGPQASDNQNHERPIAAPFVSSFTPADLSQVPHPDPWSWTTGTPLPCH